jgi:hypothetical protein
MEPVGKKEDITVFMKVEIWRKPLLRDIESQFLKNSGIAGCLKLGFCGNSKLKGRRKRNCITHPTRKDKAPRIGYFEAKKRVIIMPMLKNTGEKPDIKNFPLEFAIPI